MLALSSDSCSCAYSVESMQMFFDRLVDLRCGNYHGYGCSVLSKWSGLVNHRDLAVYFDTKVRRLSLYWVRSKPGSYWRYLPYATSTALSDLHVFWKSCPRSCSVDSNNRLARHTNQEEGRGNFLVVSHCLWTSGHSLLTTLLVHTTPNRRYPKCDRLYPYYHWPSSQLLLPITSHPHSCLPDPDVMIGYLFHFHLILSFLVCTYTGSFDSECCVQIESLDHTRFASCMTSWTSADLTLEGRHDYYPGSQHRYIW
jgi:hypothetical protein